MSLHPFAQFGQIIIYSGMSPVVIYVPSEWMYLYIYRSMQIGSDTKKRNEIKTSAVSTLWALADLFCFWWAVMMREIRQEKKKKKKEYTLS